MRASAGSSPLISEEQQSNKEYPETAPTARQLQRTRELINQVVGVRGITAPSLEHLADPLLLATAVPLPFRASCRVQPL